MCDGSFHVSAAFDIRASEHAIGVGALGGEAWAVGSTYPGNGDYRIFGAHYDGEVWTELPEPRPETGAYIGYAADVDPTGVLWVVGEYLTGTTEAHLVLRWDGEQWERMDVPPVGREGGLYGIDAVSATEAWAVGAYEASGGGERGLMMHYDGSTWTVVDGIRRRWSSLYDVSLASSADGWASARGPRRGILLRWDGASWTRTDVTRIDYLHVGAVEAESATRAWASASYETGGGPPSGIILRWNGDSWRRAGAPDAPGAEGYYDMESAAGEVWAVGGRYRRREGWIPLAIARDASGWSTVPIEDQGNGGSLEAVATTLEGAAWAVGPASVDGEQQLVVYNACPPA